jgi:ABC-type anion transport system duplicated permease subunit
MSAIPSFLIFFLVKVAVYAIFRTRVPEGGTRDAISSNILRSLSDALSLVTVSNELSVGKTVVLIR